MAPVVTNMSLDIRIEYCAAWNYEPHAVGLAEKVLALKQAVTGLTLVPSSGGRFEISVNGETIYSKLETGQFPNPDDMVEAIRKKR